MDKIKLYDSAFIGVRSMSAKGDNMSLKPTFFEWERVTQPEQVSPTDIVFFTDSTIPQAPRFPGRFKVAWLLEPPLFRPEPTRYVLDHPDHFDLILTYNRKIIDKKKFRFYPYGGSMIHPDRWEIIPKSKKVSMIVSDKNEATGHKLRHHIVNRFGGRVDILGSGYGPYVDKYDGLAPYQYSIIVQGERLDWCFDEKLIDCLAVGTIPLFWGCPDIGRFFEDIPCFETLDQLGDLLDNLPQVDPFVRYSNLVKAQKFINVEDWIYLTYYNLLV